MPTAPKKQQTTVA